jgi:Na+/melibiose symporter-like transporter
VSGVAGQDPEVLEGIRVMFCVVPAVSSAITAVIFLYFPITRARHRQALEELRRRQEAGAA